MIKNLLSQIWEYLYEKKLITFKESIYKIGKTELYFAYGNDKICDRLDITQEEFYKEVLLDAIYKKQLSVYGIKDFSFTNELQEVPIKDFNNLDSNYNIINFIGEILYTSVSIRSSELNALIKEINKEKLDKDKAFLSIRDDIKYILEENLRQLHIEKPLYSKTRDKEMLDK